MRTSARPVPTVFEADEGFELPVSAVPYRGAIESALEGLKERLLREMVRQSPDPRYHAPLRCAVNEAAALAWLTPFPLLVLPLLAEEKARQETHKTERQYAIRMRTQNLLVQAAA